MKKHELSIKHSSGHSWNSLHHPHLEYDSKTLESVQRRSTLTKESHHLPYEKRLERLGLTDLKTRRERGNFIQIYKITRTYLLNRMATPWNNLPKGIALAHSVNSFKSKLDLYLNKIGRNTHIYS